MSTKLKFRALPELVALIATFTRSANSELRVEVNRRYGKRYVSASVWFRRRGMGDWWRRSALHFAPDELDQVIVALQAASATRRLRT
jgi:hypothetical protein